MKKLLLTIIFSSLVFGFQALAVAPITEVKFNAQVPIPKTQTVGGTYDFSKGEVNFKDEKTVRPLGEYIAWVVYYIIGILGVVSTIMVMAGGLIWTMSGGDPGKIGQAKELLSRSIIAIVLASTSYLMLSVINKDLVNFKLPKIATVETMGCCQGGASCPDDATAVSCAMCKGSFFDGMGKNSLGKCVKPIPNSTGICQMPVGCGTAEKQADCTGVWLGNDMQAIIDKCGLSQTNCTVDPDLSACKLASGGMGFCVGQTCSDQKGTLGTTCGGIQVSGVCTTISKTMLVARTVNPFGYYFKSAPFNPCPIGKTWVNGGRDCEGLNLGCCK